MVDLLRGLLTREVGGPDVAFGPARVAVLALGHQLLGKKTCAGQALAFGAGDGVKGLRVHGGQAAGSVDRGVGRLGGERVVGGGCGVG
ncbi:hypothetical protein ACFTZF_41850 [Streptomyces mirabilis]|uniref:hypothetical protein n=1 Tax=Streptomyces mirabilis TaxID=68239 RepID=UPI003635A9C8